MQVRKSMTKSKTKKPRKQKAKTIKKILDQLSKSNIQTSEAVLRLGESLISRWRVSQLTQGMITLAAMAWNISLSPKDEQVDVQGIFLDALPEQLSARDIASLSEDIDVLIERKNQDYPHMRNYILNYQTFFSGNKITLKLDTATVS
jgi:hypothetical protein